MGRKYEIDPDWLRQKCGVEKLTDQEVADLIGCSRSVIQRRRTRCGIPPNDKVAWNKGRTGIYSEEVLQKMAEAAKGRTLSAGTKHKISAALRGCKFTREHRRKISEACQGRVPWNQGKPRTDAVKHQISLTLRGREITAEARRKIGAACKEHWAAGAYDDACFNPPGVVYNDIQMRSTWEARLAAAFDALGWDWEYEPESFQYELGDESHTYTPDFFVACLETYFDPHWLRDDESEKFNAIRTQHGIALIVLGEPLLKMYERGAGIG